jgi:hypothetical protein
MRREAAVLAAGVSSAANLCRGVRLVDAPQQRLSEWVVFVEDLLRRHDAGFPASSIRDMFWETFDAEPV